MRTLRRAMHEVSFDSVEPAGVNRGVHEDEGWPLGFQADDGRPAAMRGAIIDNPEDTWCGAIRLVLRDLSDEALKGSDAGLPFAPTANSLARCTSQAAR